MPDSEIYKKKRKHEDMRFEWVIDGDDYFNFKLFYNYVHSLIFVIISVPLTIFFWLVFNFSLYFPEYSNKIVVGVLWQFVMAVLVLYWGAMFYYRDKIYKFYISNLGIYTPDGLMEWDNVAMIVKFKPGIMVYGHTEIKGGPPKKYYIPLKDKRGKIEEYLEKKVSDKIKE